MFRRSAQNKQVGVCSPPPHPQMEASNGNPLIEDDAQSCVSSGSSAEWATPAQSIVIFDWDDTLCPSSWIRCNRPALSYFRPPPNEDRFVKPLEELQNCVLHL